MTSSWSAYQILIWIQTGLLTCQHTRHREGAVMCPVKSPRRQSLQNRVPHQRHMNVWNKKYHYNDVIMGTTASQITSLGLFTQPFIQTQFKENIKAPRHWLLCGEFTGTGEFRAQMASDAEMFPFDDVTMSIFTARLRDYVHGSRFNSLRPSDAYMRW